MTSGCIASAATVAAVRSSGVPRTDDKSTKLRLEPPSTQQRRQYSRLTLCALAEHLEKWIINISRSERIVLPLASQSTAKRPTEIQQTARSGVTTDDEWPGAMEQSRRRSARMRSELGQAALRPGSSITTAAKTSELRHPRCNHTCNNGRPARAATGCRDGPVTGTGRGGARPFGLLARTLPSTALGRSHGPPCPAIKSKNQRTSRRTYRGANWCRARSVRRHRVNLIVGAVVGFFSSCLQRSLSSHPQFLLDARPLDAMLTGRSSGQSGLLVPAHVPKTGG